MKRIELVLARPASGHRQPSPTYTLFRREDKPDLYCAVPEDQPVPTFLRRAHWAIVGRITKATALPGFQDQHARTGVRLSGFYLFMAHRTRRSAAACNSTPELCAA